MAELSKNYLVYYGPWDDEKIAAARKFDLIVLHPGKNNSNISTDIVKALHDGADKTPGSGDEVTVLAYVSIGEDEEVPRGPANPEDKNYGPVYFKEGIVRAQNDFPGRYLDELSYVFNGEGFFSFLPGGSPQVEKGHDGLPDENGIWHSYYVYAGDEEWQAALLEKMEVLIKEYGVDGFFLDTVDTASPWGNYGWMQKEMALLIKKIKDNFPDRYIMINRGVFLFKEYADMVRPSIDGLLFESFWTDWDWGKALGINSPYRESHDIILKNEVLPEALKPDGFQLFFLTYLDPGQGDFYPLLYDEWSMLEGIPYSYYISTPDLAKLFPPPEAYFQEGASLPEFAGFQAADGGKGRFRLNFRIQDPGEQAPGRDFFIEVRVGEKTASPEKVAFLKEVEIDYSQLEKKIEGSTIVYSYDSAGLRKNSNYFFYARIVGKNPSLQSPFHKGVLHTDAGRYPGPVKTLWAAARNKSVILTWDDPQLESSSYKVFYGRDRYSLEYYGSTVEKQLTLGGLENGQHYYFSVCPLSADGEEGSFCLPVMGTPQDLTPPLPPGNITLAYDEETLLVSWEPPAGEDLKEYRVYCFLTEKGLRLPVFIEGDKTSITFKNLEKHRKYTLLVTSVNNRNIESQPGERKDLVIP